jgi:UDP-N-acetylglucosamine 2-epimerase (non-hydrolysing)
VPALTAAGIAADLVHTGQHYDAAMSDVFFEDLQLPEPRWYLGVGSGTHATQTAAAMVKLEELLSAEQPDALVVIGVVNSTLAGALAAAKMHIPVVHVEAGLRSRDFSMPEEVNRLVTDQLSALLLTPVREADENLLREGVDPARIRFVGNIMAESLLEHVSRAREREACGRYGLRPGDYVLATIHRPENTDHPERLQEIVQALTGSPLPVLFPVHPRTRPLVAQHGLVPGAGGVVLTDPVGYLDMLSLQADAAAVVTDSGGVEEEACMLHTPCVTVRRSTERRITIDLGANRLVGAWREKILSALDEALASSREWPVPELWDEGVSARIAQALSDGVEPLPGV